MELDLSKFIVRKGLLNNRGHMKAWRSVRVRCVVHEEIRGIKNAMYLGRNSRDSILSENVY